MKKAPVAMDLFAGCGGLSRGLQLAGFDVRAAVEIDKTAREAYAANHPNTVLFEDVLDVTSKELRAACKGEPLALLAGCAPCQGFCSLTAKNKKEDPRNRLLLRMAEIIAELKPQAVMMENVPGLTQRGSAIFEEFISTLEKLDYPARNAWRILQMADYGIPQSRRRLVMLVGRGFAIPFLEPTHARQPTPESTLKRWLTLREAIGKRSLPKTLKQARADGGPSKHSWHVVRDLQPQVAERLAAAIPGKTWLELDEKFRPDCHKGSYEGFTNVYGRMSWEQTPVTITAGCTTPSKGRFGHPDKNRTTISVLESALIQTFPDDYNFVTQQMDAVCKMIGNAVPPEFARVAGDRSLQTLKSRKRQLVSRKTDYPLPH